MDPLLRLPHRGPALLLDEVLTRTENSATCRVTIRSDHPYLEDAHVPLAVSIELMAQAAAVQALPLELDEPSGDPGGPPRPGLDVGMLVAVPELELRGQPFAVGDVVEVTATREAELGGLVRFLGTVDRTRADEPGGGSVEGRAERVASGTIMVKEPPR